MKVIRCEKTWYLYGLAAAWIVQFRCQPAYRTVTTVTSTKDSILRETHYASATGISPLKFEHVKSSPMGPYLGFVLLVSHFNQRKLFPFARCAPVWWSSLELLMLVL